MPHHHPAGASSLSGFGKALLALCLALGSCGAPAKPTKALDEGAVSQDVSSRAGDSTGKPILEAIEGKLRDLFHRTGISPAVSRGDKTLTIEYKTKMYSVRQQVDRVTWSQELHPVLGPDRDGFILTLQLRQGEGYRGPLVVPQILPAEPEKQISYWRTYINAPRAKDSAEYVWMTLSFGEATDERLIRDIINAVEGLLSSRRGS